MMVEQFAAVLVGTCSHLTSSGRIMQVLNWVSSFSFVFSQDCIYHGVVSPTSTVGFSASVNSENSLKDTH